MEHRLGISNASNNSPGWADVLVEITLYTHVTYVYPTVVEDVHLRKCNHWRIFYTMQLWGGHSLRFLYWKSVVCGRPTALSRVLFVDALLYKGVNDNQFCPVPRAHDPSDTSHFHYLP